MSGQKPTHRVCYSYKPATSKDDKLTEIGAAWAHKSGFTITSDVPLTLRAGERLVMFEIKAKDKAES